MTDNKINIVFISDNNYIVNTTVAITSIKVNRDKASKYNIYLIVKNVEQRDVQKVRLLEETNFEINIIDSKVQSEQFTKEDAHVSDMALVKFALPEILNNLDKVLYIDGDIIIQDTLCELFNTRLENYYAAVVRDIMAEQGVPTVFQKLHSDLPFYFNSGMMLLNLKKMRRDNIEKKLWEYKKNGINYYMDQDALNVVFDGNVKCIPWKYNYMVTLTRSMDKIVFPQEYEMDILSTEAERLQEAKLIHLTDRMKPWKYVVPYYTELFMKYYKFSPYADSDIINPQCEQMKEQQYLFPFAKVRKGSKIAIWGAGKVGTEFYKQVVHSKYCEIIIWVDESYEEYVLNGKKVVSPEAIKTADLDCIVIAVKSEEIAERIRHEIIQLKGDLYDVIWEYPVVKHYETSINIRGNNESKIN